MNLKSSRSLLLLAVTGAFLITSAPVRASETDDRIEASAKKSYVFKTYLKDDSVKVSAKNGVVTLTGTVASEGNKSLAQDTVAGLPGVSSVDNKLKVKGERQTERSDGWLTTKVKTALLFHRSVSATKTEVQVRDGVVTLRGEASSQAQKDLSTEYAKDVEGVKDVRNEMTVASTGSPAPNPPGETIGEKLDDASITAQVKASLLSHRSTSALKTKVETNDGVVTVSGVAKNAAEKELVTKLVSDIKGVVKVVNNMTISPVASN